MSKLLDQYRELVSNYESGLYSEIELVSNTFTMLGEGNEELWLEAPDWVKESIRDRLSTINEDDNFVSFSNRTSDEIKHQLINLREWLICKGELSFD